MKEDESFRRLLQALELLLDEQLVSCTLLAGRV